MKNHFIPYLSAFAALQGLSPASLMSAEILPAIHDEYNATLRAQVPLEQGWENPPRLAQTRVWWWWLNGDTDKPTITRDLEAMKANGIGGANVIDAGGDNQEGNRRVPHGPDFGSKEWRELFSHAVAEAERLGLELGFNIQSGWNLGDPKVPIEESSKRVSFSTTPVSGGRALDLKLAQPPAKAEFYRDVAVLAVPLGSGGARPAVRIVTSSNQSGAGPEKALDGSVTTFWVSGSNLTDGGPTEAKPQWLELHFDKPIRADRMVITPRPGYGPKRGRIERIDGGKSQEIATFNMLSKDPATIRFEAVESAIFRITIVDSWDSKPGPPRNVQIAEVGLYSGTDAVAEGRPSGGIRHLDQKAYFSYPGSFTGTESWHLIEDVPDSPLDLVRKPEQVVDLTAMMNQEGRLRWQAPAGNWEILRLGYTASGAHVSTHSENAGGHCIDYLDRTTLDSYWTRTLDPIFTEVKPYLGKSLRFLHTDSWELGPVNWTRNMPAEFKRLRGYDIKPFLPVLAGHIVGDRVTSTRFLNDFRRTLADLMAENKYAGFSEKAHALGIGIHPESGGPHAGPMDALRNLGISDVPMGEFWSTSPRHRVQDFQRFYVKQTTSAAHTYGRRVSLAEAFTNIGRHWQHDPRSLKATFDRAACEGHNLTMWHTFDASPKERGMPGNAYFAGEHFNPNVTWWTQGKAFIDYMNRCHFLLQQGVGTSDVLHFYGENVPAFVRLKRDDPAKCLPGYDYDVIDMRALMERTSVDAAGNIVLPEGTSYRLLSMVPHDAISLPVLEHVAKLVGQGATMVGPRPKLQFSLSGGKVADDRFSALCDRLWGKSPAGTNRYGKGRVIQGMTTREVLQRDQVPQDFTWTGGDADTFIDFIQRRTDDTRIYFVANRNDRAENVELRFRVTGRVPEFWDPVTGVRKDATNFREENGTTVIPYPMNGEQAFFVLFRKEVPAGGAKQVPNVAKLSPMQEIEGPWQVAFDPAWGGPESITFDTLTDWTSRPEEGIRHYSGSAIYRKAFSAPAHQGPVVLDLGEVESLCEVKLNGRDLGVLWSAPFRVEVTGKIKAGENQLEVKVVNVWANRIIGDSKLPESERRTRTNITKLTKDTPLEPSGLLGPVRLWVSGGE
ncbi:MAG: glycosyl hydrolase [Luteolibacter sp.]